MDGLTIRQGQSLIDAGKTASEIKSSEIKNGGMQKTPSMNQAGEKSFADALKEAVNTVNQLQKESDQKMQQLATGKTTNIPEVMMAAEKADIGLRMMVQVRNKIIDAYQEVMKMQV